MSLELTRDLAWAAATDKGNRSMHRGGRKAWNDDDYNAATAEFHRLWPTADEPKTRTLTEAYEESAQHYHDSGAEYRP